MTLIEQLTAVITAIAEDISNNISNSGGGNTDVSVLLPRKIGASQKWYQSGLRHGAEYPYPYRTTSSVGFMSGAQYFIPFTALEDATITALEIHSTSAQANATVSLGIYASDSNNDVADPLFTSDPISCATTGAKNVPCNVQIKRGEVYWLSSLPTGTPSTPSFQRINTDSLFSIKGSINANLPPSVGYYTTGNTSMTQIAPTSKLDISNYAPRVLFITG